MTNRIEDNDEAAKQKVIKNARLMQDAAQTIYSLIPPGANVRIEWMEQPSILTPDSQPKRHVLNVAKPALDLVMQFKIQ